MLAFWVLSFYIVEPITFDTNPDDVTVAIGEEASFTAQASGDNPQYVWNFGGNPIVPDVTKYSGINEATLTVMNADNSDEGDYTVTVSNAATPGVTSAAATLTVCELHSFL